MRLYISIYLLFDDKNVEQSLLYNHKLTSLRKDDEKESWRCTMEPLRPVETTLRAAIDTIANGRL